MKALFSFRIICVLLLLASGCASPTVIQQQSTLKVYQAKIDDDELDMFISHPFWCKSLRLELTNVTGQNGFRVYLTDKPYLGIPDPTIDPLYVGSASFYLTETMTCSFDVQKQVSEFLLEQLPRKFPGERPASFPITIEPIVFHRNDKLMPITLEKAEIHLKLKD